VLRKNIFYFVYIYIYIYIWYIDSSLILQYDIIIKSATLNYRSMTGYDVPISYSFCAFNREVFNSSVYISIVKPMWPTFYSIYWELRACTCFGHYLLILRRRYTNDTWYIACVLCQLAAPGLEWNWHNTHAISKVPPDDEQVMLETCRGPQFLINWIKSASRWFHYTDIVWCTVNKTLSSVYVCYMCGNRWCIEFTGFAEQKLDACEYPYHGHYVVCLTGNY
jgi:hypothetical protein